jgi:hypothetical protein
VSANAKGSIARRPLILATLGLAVAGGLAYEAPRWWRRRYPPSPFDDLLVLLDDRESAARLGAAMRAGTPGFNPAAAARLLRQRLAQGGLADAVRADIDAARMGVVHGWILPESVLLLAGIADAADAGAA